MKGWIFSQTYIDTGHLLLNVTDDGFFGTADIDIQLLLAVQYSCNKGGTKIPWKEVAEVMGPKFTEGAIVQHLSKLRSKREEQEKWNPPPLKRAVGSSVPRDMGPKKTLLPSPMGDTPPRPKRSKGGSKRKAVADSSDESDADYEVKRKTANRATQSGPPKAFQNSENAKGSSSDKSKLVHVNAPWLRQFDSHNESDGAEAFEGTSGSDQVSSETNTQSDLPNTKIVTLKVKSDKLANVHNGSLSRYVDPSSFPAPITPTQPPRVIVNQAPQRRSSFMPYMPDFDDSAFPNLTDSGSYAPFGVQYPSSDPSPFNLVDPTSTPTPTRNWQPIAPEYTYDYPPPENSYNYPKRESSYDYPQHETSYPELGGETFMGAPDPMTSMDFLNSNGLDCDQYFDAELLATADNMDFGANNLNFTSSYVEQDVIPDVGQDMDLKNLEDF